jgi:retinoid hydroxylase
MIPFHVAFALILGDETNIHEWQTQFQQWTSGLFSLPVNLPITAFGRAVRARNILLRPIEEAITARKNDLRDGTDALTVLQLARDENGGKLSNAEMADQLLTLLFAGHETSSSALGSFCLLITQHPEVLERLRREQWALNHSGPLTIDVIRQMPYFYQVMKEVGRFMPPVGGGLSCFPFQSMRNGHQEGVFKADRLERR